MIAANDKILVSVDLKQKSSIEFSDKIFSLALEFETNYREKSPVVATVEQDHDLFNKGDIIVTHHNLFLLPSPHYLGGGLYSIPVGKIIFAKLNKETGDLIPVCTNIFGERVVRETVSSGNLLLTPDEKIKYHDRVIITKSSVPKYKKGTMILSRPHACYDIVYVWNKQERRITKISEDMVIGYVK